MGLAGATDDLSYLAFSVAGVIATVQGVRLFRATRAAEDRDGTLRLQAIAAMHAGPVFVIVGVLIATGVLPA